MPSFDITSKVDLQEVDNAINQAKKELAQRFDFKGSKATIDLKAKENLIELVADDSMKMEAVWEIVQSRLHRRGVPIKNLKPGENESIGGGLLKRKIELQQGVPSDSARDIAKFAKDQKMKKITVAIMGDQLRVTSGSRDELQAAIAAFRGQDFGVELQFGNFRE